MNYPLIGLVILGLFYGSIVSFFNHRLLVNGWNKITPENLTRIKKLKRNVMLRYAIHFVIDIVALFIVAKSIPLLLGTAAGIIVTQKILIVRYIKTGKEVKK